MHFRLGINTGFAVNRYSEPEEWTRIVGQELGLRFVQLTADLLNPSLPGKILNNHVQRIAKSCDTYRIGVTSTFTGAFTRLNHLAHPDSDVRAYWVSWFKQFIDLTADLGAEAMGSHFGIQTLNDFRNPNCQEERQRQSIDCWHEIGSYARDKDLNFLSWEPMSIGREHGETLEKARILQDLLNENSPIPFKMCLDVDHGDIASENLEDSDPYAWLRNFASESPQIHLKQCTKDKRGHWPFTSEYNAEGRILPKKVLDSLMMGNLESREMILEISFREREPTDSNVVNDLKESVRYWRNATND